MKKDERRQRLQDAARAGSREAFLRLKQDDFGKPEEVAARGTAQVLDGNVATYRDLWQVRDADVREQDDEKSWTEGIDGSTCRPIGASELRAAARSFSCSTS